MVSNNCLHTAWAPGLQGIAIDLDWIPHLELFVSLASSSVRIRKLCLENGRWGRSLHAGRSASRAPQRLVVHWEFLPTPFIRVDIWRLESHHCHTSRDGLHIAFTPHLRRVAPNLDCFTHLHPAPAAIVHTPGALSRDLLVHGVAGIRLLRRGFWHWWGFDRSNQLTHPYASVVGTTAYQSCTATQECPCACDVCGNPGGYGTHSQLLAKGVAKVAAIPS
mmetsp:Transcript_11177/g.25628  ORF Transcript_11177/g.25628 Transcript_11177/m.25628 type:complete len:220 (-) Transcript_11177:422-1081(-)